MHDLDRTLNELNDESADEYGFEMEDAFESSDESPDEVLAEEEEMALASELLSVTSEAELDHFLGKLIRRAGKAVGKFVKSGAGRALGGILKSAAKVALPIVGNAIAPGVGGALASAAGDAFGLEAEGLSGEDAEWESAKRFIKFADLAAKTVARTHGGAPPAQAAKTAAVAAARKYAPGLLRQAFSLFEGEAAPGSGVAPSIAAAGKASTGRWVRRGSKIVLLGV
jgi:hypothetical protein